MQVSIDEKFRAELLQRIKERYKLQGQHRAGTHLSDLIYCLTKSYWKKTVGVVLTDSEVLLFAVGLGLETVLLENVDDTHRPEPVVLDGIVLSPDYISDGTLGELKSTRLYFAKGSIEPSKGWPAGWIKQMKGYAYAQWVGAVQGAEGTEYRLAVLQVIGAQLEARRFSFTEEELLEFWAWVTDRRDVLEKALAQMLPPEPFVYTDTGKVDDWQCRDCSMKMLCEVRLRSGQYVKAIR